MHAVTVSNINETTNEKQLRDFFEFCGPIETVDHKGSTAHISFKNPSAAKTALMLNGGTLDGHQLDVTSEKDHQDVDEDHDGTPLQQTDKPRAGIAAEYLARGYVLSDNVLQRAIELDQQRGISKRFLAYIKSLDTTLGAKALGPDQTISGKVQSSVSSASQSAKTMDEQKGYSKTAVEYYSKALQSPFGQKVLAFYTTTSKQVLDIHEEARRIADENKQTATSEPAAPAA
ncbi:hypothetical protein C8J56DRAFT_9400 [Mycena floridula]|nr:hypothetical protein C8J56DRAFT_9400 [Mycena floridula]